MTTVLARDALSDRYVRVDAESRPADVLREVQQRKATHAAVFDADKFINLVRLQDVLLTSPERIFADLVPDPAPPSLAPETPVDDVSRLLLKLRTDALPVLSPDERFVGVVTQQEVCVALLEESRCLRVLVEREQAKADAILETVSDGVITFNEQGTIESYNTATGHIFGCLAENLIGQDISVLIPSARNLYQEVISNSKRGSNKAKTANSRGEFEATRKDGKIIVVEFAVSLLLHEAKVLLVGIVHDITQRNWAEKRLKKARGDLEARVRDRTSQLTEANQQLQLAMADRERAEQRARKHLNELAHVSRVTTMGEMATGLAHELNQPLAAMANYCYAGEQALADSGSAGPESLRGLFEKLTGQAMRAGQIIRRLRALVDKRTYVRSRVDVVEPIQEVLHLLQLDLRQSTVRVEQQLDHPILAVTIDEIQIQQVLVNLVRNAIDAMSETQRERRSLAINTSRKDDHFIEVSVSDTGKGVCNELKDRVFDAFFSTKTEGMGMGLTISRTIIESHGGRLWLTPNSDRGVTFHFTLPIAKEASDDDGELANGLCVGR